MLRQAVAGWRSVQRRAADDARAKLQRAFRYGYGVGEDEGASGIAQQAGQATHAAAAAVPLRLLPPAGGRCCGSLPAFSQRACCCSLIPPQCSACSCACGGPLPPACRSDAPPPGSRSRLNALTEESETAHKLFDNARLPPELTEAAAAGGGTAQAAGGAAGAAAADAAALEALESSAVGRAFSVLGNVLFFGGVAAASFFGYYTYSYNCDQVGGWAQV